MTPTENWLGIGRLSDKDARLPGETSTQAKGRSLRRQEASCTNLCAVKGGTWLGFVWDEDVSGKFVDERPALIEVEQRIAAGLAGTGPRVHVLCAEETDRLHRNNSRFDVWVARVLMPAGVRIELVRGFYDTSTAANWFATQQLGLVSEFGRRQISDKQKSDRQQKRAKGMLVGGRPFATMSDGGPVRVKDPAAYPYLLEMFERRAAGEAYQSIADDFTARAVPTAAGGKWDRQTIRGIVRCRWYIGQTLHKGQVVCGADGLPLVYEHDCMVPVDLWSKANSRNRGGNLARGYIYLLSRPGQSLLCCPHRILRSSGEPVPLRGRWIERPGLYAYRMLDQEHPLYATDRDEHAAQIPTYLPAAETEAEVVERVLLASRDNEVLTAIAADGQDVPGDRAQAASELAAGIRKLRVELANVQQGLQAALREGHAYVMSVAEAEAARLAAELATQEHRLSALHAKPVRVNDVAPVERINTLEACWREGLRLEAQNQLFELLNRVEVRHDGLHLYFRGCSVPKKESPEGWGVSLWVLRCRASRRA